MIFWVREVLKRTVIGDWRFHYECLEKKNYCKETKLEELHFKLIHRIIVAKKEFSRYGVKGDHECLYCGEKDSIDHTFINCQFVRLL